jgi:hypothetical protein
VERKAPGKVKKKGKEGWDGEELGCTLWNAHACMYVQRGSDGAREMGS